MAEVTAMRNVATDYPIYGCPYVITYPIWKADGLATGPAGLDAEISKNGDTFVDCTNEGVEIATASGMVYLSLTAAELTCDVATIQQKSSTSGALPTPVVLKPQKLATVRSGTSASAGTLTNVIILDSGASAIDGYYTGMVCVATIDSNIEVRIISGYVGSTKTASVIPDWNVAPDNNDPFDIKLPRGVTLFNSSDVMAFGGIAGGFATGIPQVNTVRFNGTAVVSSSGRPEVNTTHHAGVAVPALVSGRFDVSVGAYQSGLTPLQPTTAGRTLDVSAAGEAGIDWANIGAPTTTVNLSGTTVKNSTDISAIVSTLPAAATIADSVVDKALAGHTTAGTVGAALTAASSAGDPWSTSLPGSYGAGTAGNIIGGRIDTTISSRASQASVDTVDNFIDTEVAAIKAVTDQLPSGGALTDLPVNVTKWRDQQPALLQSSLVNVTLGSAQPNVITASALAADAVDEILDEAVEGGITLRQSVRLILAMAAGRVSGAGTNTITFRDVNNTKVRITATVDTGGNRTAITIDGS